MVVKFLKFKYVDVFVVYFLEEDLLVGMIKNCLLVLCWWVEKIGKKNVVVKDNVYYGIVDCVFVMNELKVRDIDQVLLVIVVDFYIRMSLEL